MPSSEFQAGMPLGLRPEAIARPAAAGAARPRPSLAERAASFERVPPREHPAPGPGPGPDVREPHARFIPREELKDYASWRPGRFGGTEEPPASPPPDPAEAAARRAAQARQAREAALAAARREGYAEGYRDGLAALESFKQAYAQQLGGSFAALQTRFAEQLDALEAGLAVQVADIAVALAGQVLRERLTARPEAVLRVAEEALAATVGSARALRMRLHPEDLQLVAREAGESLAARGVVLQADAGLARGGLLLDSELGRVDARLETRWRQATAELGRPQAVLPPAAPAMPAPALPADPA